MNKMMKNKRNLKAIVLSLVLAVMLPAMNVNAQSLLGGSLLDEYYAEQDAANQGGMLRSATRDQESISIGESGITHDNFGETPVGSGIAILLLAGAGYAVIRKKED